MGERIKGICQVRDLGGLEYDKIITDNNITLYRAAHQHLSKHCTGEVGIIIPILHLGNRNTRGTFMCDATSP